MNIPDDSDRIRQRAGELFGELSRINRETRDIDAALRDDDSISPEAKAAIHYREGGSGMGFAEQAAPGQMSELRLAVSHSESLIETGLAAFTAAGSDSDTAVSAGVEAMVAEYRAHRKQLIEHRQREGLDANPGEKESQRRRRELDRHDKRYRRVLEAVEGGVPVKEAMRSEGFTPAEISAVADGLRSMRQGVNV